MVAEKFVEEALQEAQERGLKIVRGPCFVWGPDDVLEAVDWCGAVLVKMGRAEKGFPEGWLREFCRFLKKDLYWFRNFNYGFSQLRAIEVYSVDKETKGVVWCSVISSVH